MSDDEDRLGDLCQQLNNLKKRGDVGAEILEALKEDYEKYDLPLCDVSINGGVLSFSLLGIKIEVRIEGNILPSDGPRSRLSAWIVPSEEDENPEKIIDFSVFPDGTVADKYKANTFFARFFSDLISKLKEREETFPNLVIKES